MPLQLELNMSNVRLARRDTAVALCTAPLYTHQSPLH